MSSGGRASPKLIDHKTILASYGPAAERLKSRQCSRVTNGSALLPRVDGRSAWVRRCKDIIEAHLSDLGGEHNTSVFGYHPPSRLFFSRPAR
jgi:hypothetical protein